MATLDPEVYPILTNQKRGRLQWGKGESVEFLTLWFSIPTKENWLINPTVHSSH